ncbi:MAG: S1C family serine protease [Acidimicrobiales bacterium]
MSVLDELQVATTAVAERVGPSVVGIGRGWGGSGVVLADGQVLTNAHNLHGPEVTVGFGGTDEKPGRRATGQVTGVDVDGDLAVVSVDTAGAPPVVWADGPPPLGTVVFALANPGGAGLRVTLGQVSATDQAFRGPRGRRIRGSLEHSAPMAKGSSGGAVVDADGRLLGLNTNRLGQGFYLAIPADADLRARVDRLARGESAERPHLGVALAPPRAARQLRQAVGLPERDGLLVRAVEDASPAAEAGLRTGDLLVGAGGSPLASMDDLHDAIDAAGPSGSLTVQIVRGTDESEVTVRLAG